MQTATDDIDPQSLDQRLRALGSDIAAIAAKEQEAIRRRAEQQSALRKDMAARDARNAEKLNRLLSALGAKRQQSIEEQDERRERRTAWLQRAYHAAKKSLLQRAQGIKDHRIGKVQGTIMRNRQARKDEFAAAKAKHHEFRKLLAGDRSARQALRKDALGALRSYRLLVGRKFDKKREDSTKDDRAPDAIRQEMQNHLAEATEAVAVLKSSKLAMLFRYVPLLVLLGVAGGIHAWLAMKGGGFPAVIPTLAISCGAILGLWLLGLMLVGAPTRKAADALAKVRALGAVAEQGSEARLAEFASTMEQDQAIEGESLGETFRESDEISKQHLSAGQKKLDAQFARLPAKIEALYARAVGAIETVHLRESATARETVGVDEKVDEDFRSEESARIEEEFQAKIGGLEADWKQSVLPSTEVVTGLERESQSRFPEWTSEVADNWNAGDDDPAVVRVGRREVDAAVLSSGLPRDPRLELPAGANLRAPFSLTFPNHASVLLETGAGGDTAAAAALNAIVVRLLATFPPGRVSFVFIDPVGLGKDFAGLMHLADYEETMITHRIWTQTTHIEERLAEINEHIEKVIQMYLRNEFADITEFNAQAGAIAEKYRFVVIAGFPSGFSETACKRLMSIAASGARCGVHLLLQQDSRVALPDPALAHELARSCAKLTFRDGAFHLTGAPRGADTVVFDPPPVGNDLTTLVHRIGSSSIDSNRVQVPFATIAPNDSELWSGETSDELRVPIGRTGAKKLQMLAIGKGTRQHALVAGKTGSGKSTLFHVIITNLALWCSPEQVEFYLVDFKKGVEFKCYAAGKLPHARVIAIESDREFALSVLQRLDAELRRRGELFRKAGSQDVAGYKRGGGAEPMPRCLLLIDEFQEFFTEDDAVAQEASLLLDRIVRQGRAFGIHVILGSQTLGGAYTLARATLGQMVVRIALQCNEADAHLIMDEDNPAPRLLTRPGEGIYNDQAGALAANSPFQIVWLPESDRDAALAKIHRLDEASQTRRFVPVIFEGNAPADVHDNPELIRLRHDGPPARADVLKAWLGAPNSIKGPTEALFRRQSGSHLLIVGQAAERSMAMLGIAIASLAAQTPPEGARFVVLDPLARGDDGLFQKIARALPHQIEIGGVADAGRLLAEVAAEMDKRSSGNEAGQPAIFIIIHDLHRFKTLRPDDEFRFSMDEDAAASPSQLFANLLGEGGSAGIHFLVSTDTWNNLSRWVPRKLLAEFEMRVLFQMSANDSSNLIDSPAATGLGLHRALFYNEHHGTLETFRPYAMPEDEWWSGTSSR